MGVLGGGCEPAQRMCGDQRASPASVFRCLYLWLDTGRSLPWNFTLGREAGLGVSSYLPASAFPLSVDGVRGLCQRTQRFKVSSRNLNLGNHTSETSALLMSGLASA